MLENQYLWIKLSEISSEYTEETFCKDLPGTHQEKAAMGLVLKIISGEFKTKILNRPKIKILYIKTYSQLLQFWLW